MLGSGRRNHRIELQLWVKILHRSVLLDDEIVQWIVLLNVTQPWRKYLW